MPGPSVLAISLVLVEIQPLLLKSGGRVPQVPLLERDG